MINLFFANSELLVSPDGFLHRGDNRFQAQTLRGEQVVRERPKYRAQREDEGKQKPMRVGRVLRRGEDTRPRSEREFDLER